MALTKFKSSSGQPPELDSTTTYSTQLNNSTNNSSQEQPSHDLAHPNHLISSTDEPNVTQTTDYLPSMKLKKSTGSVEELRKRFGDKANGSISSDTTSHSSNNRLSESMCLISGDSKSINKAIKESSSSSSSLNCSTSSIQIQLTDKKIKQQIKLGIKSANKNNKKNANKPLTTSSQPISNQSAPSSPSAKTRKFSKSHQLRFHRRFPAVNAQEQLIDWYSCALIADILLQGYLYISENYFCFYSNIFGYKTQLLIPIRDVISVTKERTAKIFPNAVGISTAEAKYSFGSLLSREATFRLMQEVWRTTLLQTSSASYYNPHSVLDLKSISESEQTNNNLVKGTKGEGTESDQEKNSSNPTTPPMASSLPSSSSACQAKVAFPLVQGAILLSSGYDDEGQSSSESEDYESHRELSLIDERLEAFDSTRFEPQVQTHWRSLLSLEQLRHSWRSASNGSRLLFGGVVMLVFLFVSAGVLLYRLQAVHERLSALTTATSHQDKRFYGLEGRDLEKGHGLGLEDVVKNEVKRLAIKLKTKLEDFSSLRCEMEELLEDVQRLPDMCSK